VTGTFNTLIVYHLKHWSSPGLSTCWHGTD